MVLQKLCISQQESGRQYTYPKVNTWRSTNYIEAQRLLKNDMPQRHNKERHKQSCNQKIPIEASYEKIRIEPTRPKILRATWIKDIMIWAKEWSKETRESPHDLCTHKNFCIWIQSAQNRIIAPPKSIETYNKSKWACSKQILALATNKWLSNHVKEATKNRINQNDVCESWKSTWED